ncbi:hypothetical protein AM1_0337 [Acaryochloris marina MBIC11017]|uniref:Uncharacterized protein n=1 Tax=Acaryochloris marina (strain MBIC 11017) TaxID=329726 RepID=B0C9V6_ACAM1|nr:hypothetical protein AM1_0337 [Acaryochloris marina MBIC11017]
MALLNLQTQRVENDRLNFIKAIFLLIPGDFFDLSNAIIPSLKEF